MLLHQSRGGVYVLCLVLLTVTAIVRPIRAQCANCTNTTTAPPEHNTTTVTPIATTATMAPIGTTPAATVFSSTSAQHSTTIVTTATIFGTNTTHAPATTIAPSTTAESTPTMAPTPSSSVDTTTTVVDTTSSPTTATTSAVITTAPTGPLTTTAAPSTTSSSSSLPSTTTLIPVTTTTAPTTSKVVSTVAPPTTMTMTMMTTTTTTDSNFTHTSQPTATPTPTGETTTIPASNSATATASSDSGNGTNTATTSETSSPTSTSANSTTEIPTPTSSTTAPIGNCTLSSSLCDANHTASVRLTGGRCECLCRNEWQGSLCDVCSAQYLQPQCVSCTANRFFATCDAAAFVVASILSERLPSNRIKLGTDAAATRAFWITAVSTMLQQQLTQRCVSSSTGLSAIVTVTEYSVLNIFAEAQPYQLSFTLASTFTIASGSAPLSATQVASQNSLVASASSCALAYLRDYTAFPPLNNGTSSDGVSTDFFTVMAASSSANYSAVNPCGVTTKCTSSAVTAGGTLPSDPAVLAAAAANAPSPSGMTVGTLALIAVVGLGVLVAMIAFAIYMVVRRRRQSKIEARRELGISFATAMECDNAISDMSLEQAAAVLRGEPPNAVFRLLQQQHEMLDL